MTYHAMCMIGERYHDNIGGPYETLEEAVAAAEEWLSDLTPRERVLAKAWIEQEADDAQCHYVRDVLPGDEVLVQEADKDDEARAANKAIEVGTRIGDAIARDVLAEGMPRDWTGLDAQDGDQLTAAGIEPDTPEWDEAVAAAKAEYHRRLMGEI